MKQNLIFAGLVIVLIAAIAGGYYFPKMQLQAIGGSPTGTTFNTAHFAGNVVNLANAGTNGTSTSILNTDAFDRKITNFRYDCSGVGTSLTAYTGTGLVGLTFTFATTSAANLNSVGGNANSAVVQVSTSTVDSYNTLGASTSTPNALTRVWTSGSYLTIQSNATNTATCTVGADYIGS